MYYGDDDDNESQRFKFEMSGTNELIIIGINPSKARGVSKNYKDWTDDPTIDRAIAFSTRKWNYQKETFDGFLMLNVCAQSDSKPENIEKEQNRQLHQTNLKKIETYLKGKSNVFVLLAYGDAISKVNYLKENLKDIVFVLKQHNPKPVFFWLGKTQKGNPRHLLPKNFSQLPITTPLEEITSEKLAALLN